MDNPKYSKIYCSRCGSDKISLDEMKCLNCETPFTDEDIQTLLTEAYQDHIAEQQSTGTVEIRRILKQ